MKYPILLILIAGALGGYYYYQQNQLQPAVVAQPATAPIATPISKPMPALAKATPPPNTPAPRQFTPDGVFVVVKPASIETLDGIVGVKPGDTVKATGEDGVYLFNGSMKIPLRADQVTNDVLTARAAIAHDRAEQASLQGVLILSNLDETLAAAAQGRKLTFLLMGRSTCSICNGTREGIRTGKIMVTGAHFVMADINADDPVASGEFAQKFGQGFGNTLPFVAITDSSGKLLASSGGYKSTEQWNAILRDALQKAAPPKSAR